MRGIYALILAGVAFFQVSYAQSGTSRHPGGGDVPSFRVNSGLPCEGTVLFEEDFESGLPVGWITLDLDGFTPNAGTLLSPGWQVREDYKEQGDTALVSPSWYESPGASDDWIITPSIVLGSNSCFSWSVYSQDRYYPESYEIRISTTTPDTAGFFAHPPLLTVDAEGYIPDFASVNLAAFSGQSVYLALRQTSDDQFVLVVDDFQVSNVNLLDAAPFALDPVSVDFGDTVTIAGDLANLGSDTITHLTVSWQVDGGAINSVTYDSLKLAPHSTIGFSHDSLYFADSVDAFHSLCVWTSLPNNGLDQDLSNDTLCMTIKVGHPIHVSDPLRYQVDLFPNPAKEWAIIRVGPGQSMNNLSFSVFDFSGKILQKGPVNNQGEAQIQVGDWPSGLYFVEILRENERVWVGKLRH